MLRRVRLDEQQLHQEEQRLSQQLQSAEAAAQQSVAALEERMAQLEAGACCGCCSSGVFDDTQNSKPFMIHITYITYVYNYKILYINIVCL